MVNISESQILFFILHSNLINIFNENLSSYNLKSYDIQTLFLVVALFVREKLKPYKNKHQQILKYSGYENKKHVYLRPFGAWCGSSGTAMADDVTVGGIRYETNENAGTAKAMPLDDGLYSGDITVPASVHLRWQDVQRDRSGR